MTTEARTGKALILASKAFEEEQPWKSWYEVIVTLVAYGACLWVVSSIDLLALQVAAALLAGFVQFRMFSLFHDHNHGALLTKSRLGHALMSAIGVFILTPRPVWKETHDFHHWHNGKLAWTSIGSYPVMTVEQLAEATPSKRRRYLWRRHPLAILLGYFTVGVGGMCMHAFLRAPKRHYMGPVALALHFGGLALLAWLLGPLTALLVWVVPTAIDHAVASYLFYVQHNFPQTKFYPRGGWNYTDAALHGSSFLEMGPLMRWLTANIGYHHVHHLNHRIPSYRLPEAMAAMPELQSPHRISLRLADVLACLRLKVWDPETSRMQPAAATKPSVADARSVPSE